MAGTENNKVKVWLRNILDAVRESLGFVGGVTGLVFTVGSFFRISEVVDDYGLIGSTSTIAVGVFVITIKLIRDFIFRKENAFAAQQVQKEMQASVVTIMQELMSEPEMAYEFLHGNGLTSAGAYNLLLMQQKAVAALQGRNFLDFVKGDLFTEDADTRADALVHEVFKNSPNQESMAVLLGDAEIDGLDTMSDANAYFALRQAGVSAENAANYILQRIYQRDYEGKAIELLQQLNVAEPQKEFEYLQDLTEEDMHKYLQNVYVGLQKNPKGYIKQAGHVILMLIFTAFQFGAPFGPLLIDGAYDGHIDLDPEHPKILMFSALFAAVAAANALHYGYENIKPQAPGPQQLSNELLFALQKLRTERSQETPQETPAHEQTPLMEVRVEGDSRTGHEMQPMQGG